MSSGGDSYYFGDSVNMYGGRENTGIDKRQTALDTERLTEELLPMIRELRDLLAAEAPASAQVIDDNLPVIASGADASPERRRGALYAVAAIAATVSTVGPPIVEAANKLIALLGG
ncbi:hypothetical protein [Streptomyces cavernicola]|uniref:Uncharacterized protein n=1 Tax=Streptomyces cavernicola TaxID=3043613 RepID=A0ABT6S2M7_9ACTN|nr:hypothetical protein [Streptomyces sp. B-S-A6]MDI3402355.1 hypothetical protein [Streptomyces sp. B-S-A6]